MIILGLNGSTETIVNTPPCSLTWSDVTRSLQLDPANLVEIQDLLLKSQT